MRKIIGLIFFCASFSYGSSINAPGVAGSGDMVLASTQTSTGGKTFSPFLNVVGTMSVVASTTPTNEVTISTAIGGAYQLRVSSIMVEMMAQESVTSSSSTISGVSGLNVKYGATVGSITVTGPYVSSGLIKTANYTITQNDQEVILASGPASGGITITLPALSVAVGKYITITKVDRSTNSIRINSASNELIMASTGTLYLDAPGASARLVSDGNAWWPIGRLPIRRAWVGGDYAYSASQSMASSTTVVAAFHVEDPVCISSGGVYITGGNASNAYWNAGIYVATGTILSTLGLTRIATTSPSTATSQGWITAPLVTPICLSPGIYYSALTSRLAALTFASTNNSFFANTPYVLPGSFRNNTVTNNLNVGATINALVSNPNGTPAIFWITFAPEIPGS